MKELYDSDAALCPETLLNSEEEDEAKSHFIVVELEDEDLKVPTEAELSIFAPVDSSECDEDHGDHGDHEDLEDHGDHEDDEDVSTWRGTNTRDRVSVTDDFEDVDRPSGFKGDRKKRQKLWDRRRSKKSLKCGAAADRGMNEALLPEENTCYQAPANTVSAQAPVNMSGLQTIVSPLAAIEPPVFPNTPVLSQSVVGEDQHTILLEVLNHCKFLHAAVERLEQKIDKHMLNQPRYERSSARFNGGPKKRSKASAEDDQVSCSLAQRLGPPVQRNPQWIPPWKRNATNQGHSRADLQANNNYLQSTTPPDGGRGRGRGRGRRGRNTGTKRCSKTSDPAPLKDGMSTAEMDGPQPFKVMKKSSQPCMSKQKRKKKLDGDHVESEMFRKEVTLEAGLDKVMIGSSLRKVWIPLSVYKAVFKEKEPQKAVVPVLYSLFSNSILSCSAITGNPEKGIKQLDPNKIEALREFLAEMYPQHDVSLRSVTWAMCVGEINRITKYHKRQAEKQSQLPEKVGDCGT